MSSGDGAGGASVTNDTPTIGGSATNYGRTPWPSGGAEIEIRFPEGKRYIGLWWSAGNIESGGGITNFIEFYNGDDLLATMTSNRVMEILGGSVPNPYPGSETLMTLGGGSYNIGYYYGHPATHESLSPTSKSSWTGDYPFVYLNLFTIGATRVDRVVIGGDGFEFDNFATSGLEQTPTDDMVLVEELTDTVTPIDNSGSGGSDASDNSATDASSLAATGFDLQGSLFAATIIIALGATLLVASRHRR